MYSFHHTRSRSTDIAGYQKANVRRRAQTSTVLKSIGVIGILFVSLHAAHFNRPETLPVHANSDYKVVGNSFCVDPIL